MIILVNGVLKLVLHLKINLNHHFKSKILIINSHGVRSALQLDQTHEFINFIYKIWHPTSSLK